MRVILALGSFLALAFGVVIGMPIGQMRFTFGSDIYYDTYSDTY